MYMYALCSLHASSAVNANDLAIDPLAVLGGKEANDTGNVDGLADTVHWGPGSGVLNKLLATCTHTA
jgi:hypothetical protein